MMDLSNHLRTLADAFRGSFSKDDAVAWSSLDAVNSVDASRCLHESLGSTQGAWLINAVLWAVISNLRNRGGGGYTPDGAVYFLRNDFNKQIKIGFTSKDVETRISQFKDLTGFECTLLGSIKCHRSLEVELHQRFRHLRQIGEWFSPGDDLLEYLADSIELPRLSEERERLETQMQPGLFITGDTL